MSLTVNCERVQSGEMAEKYLAARLLDDERDAYELHYFECARCFEELQNLREVQQALASVPPHPTTVAPRRFAHLASRLGAAALAAGAIIGVWLWTRPATRPDTRPDLARVSPPPPIAQPSEDLLARLARFDPPPYRPTVVRGAGDGASGDDFQVGMQFYRNGSFAAAIPSLSKAAPKRVDAAFFLAACYLLTRDGAGAISAANAVLEAGDTPYREEALFLLAKARLSQKDIAGAEKDLNAVLSLDGDLRAKAADLLAAIKALHSSR